MPVDPAVHRAVPRSPEWPRVEAAHLRRQPRCQCCKPGTNTTAGLQVHHIFPFHYCIALGRADLELDERNLITLCEDEAGERGDDHHLLIGHLDDFESSNLAVETDARTTFFGMSSVAIRSDPRWLSKEKHRLRPLGRMTPTDEALFRHAMNTRFPLRLGRPDERA